MIQNIRKNKVYQRIIFSLLFCLVVALGCYMTKRNFSHYRPNDPVYDNSKEDSAVAILDAFFEKGKEEEVIPSLDNIRLQEVLYGEEDGDVIVCSTYQLLESNSDSYPFYSICLGSDDGKTLSIVYDDMSYLQIMEYGIMAYQVLENSNFLSPLDTTYIQKALSTNISPSQDFPSVV